MSNKKFMITKAILLFLFLNFTQLAKSQPRIELGGGIQAISYKTFNWSDPRATIAVPEIFFNNKLGLYFSAEFIGSMAYGFDDKTPAGPIIKQVVDNFGITYKLNNKWSLYLGHSLINTQAKVPGEFPFRGRKDLGASYAFQKIPMNLKFGYAFWIGPTLQLTFNVVKFKNDKDKDGVNDKKDKCLNTPEKFAKNVDATGCPIDSDKDGVPDLEDKCLNTPEKFAKNVDVTGCPIDSDQDGVPDLEDKCINEKGILSNDGCPVIPIVVKDSFESNKIVIDTINNTKPSKNTLLSDKEQQKYLSTNIIPLFQFNDYKLTQEYKNSLNDLVVYLKTNKSIKIILIGYTDDKGTPEYNQILSVKRADEVKYYLISQGIYTFQIESKGLGINNPKYPGNSDEDRAKNRRVEIEFNH